LIERLERVWRIISIGGARVGHACSDRREGVLIIPVVQGRSDGIDAYTAICRALGVLPGSPARQQVTDRTQPTPVSQVVWTPDSNRSRSTFEPVSVRDWEFRREKV
jgi:hypothetical protein